MKTIIYLTLAAATALLSSCRNGNGDYDASGIFETTEITVSARGTGELTSLDVEEGMTVKAGQPVGYIDTVQLHLKKEELMASLQATDSRRYNISQQIASLKQEITTQKNEQIRFRNLVEDKAANSKQLDDINARIAVLEKQLAAQTETLENSNRGVSGQVRMLEAQIAQVEDMIRKCAVTSPVDGTVLTKYAEQGEMAAQGRSLFKVGDLTDMYLRAYITADQLTELKIGQEVKVYADEGKTGRREYRGTVSWISDKAEFTPKTIQTRDERANLVYAVKIAVTNDGYIKRGMYGEIKTD